MVKPYQKLFFKFIKERTNAKLFYHSCDSIVSILDDLIEIGVESMPPGCCPWPALKR